MCWEVNVCSCCSTETDGSCPMPAATIFTKAGTDNSAWFAMSITALQQMVRASPSRKAPIEVVSVASERSSNLMIA